MKKLKKIKSVGIDSMPRKKKKRAKKIIAHALRTCEMVLNKGCNFICEYGG